MDFSQFKGTIDQHFNVNLNGYKEKQLKRRIESLMRQKGFSDYATYFEALKRNKGLWAEFMDKLTINVSEFFRNPDIFAHAEREILPALYRQFKTLKVWSAACSNGAEPYSLAMILHEFGGRHTIDATDMDEKVLLTAKGGKYAANLVKNVSENRLRQYFTESAGIYHLSSTIKDHVTFRRHDLLKDRYGKGYHLIVCRNVTIYFTKEAQWELYQKFVDALVEGGILFIGATESILNYRELGLVKSSSWFYRKEA
ncbi:protein-glutamate O-methyltransferase CheR [Metallumcola ferriviriculae]|uniref:protein-glutamate O-methyltransferase n=1 Tax=Metallumcola ferriviriculae TaxID=3039180 RepID=A0AAU0URY1_9FIRM|nr:protein-glutamate O-methyltransferase CheR [Desulfitibacteraceae bacterium MK1]